MGIKRFHQFGIACGDRGKFARPSPEDRGGCRAFQPVIDAELQVADQREGKVVRDMGLPPAPARCDGYDDCQQEEGRYKAFRCAAADSPSGDKGEGRHGRECSALREYARAERQEQLDTPVAPDERQQAEEA